MNLSSYCISIFELRVENKVAGKWRMSLLAVRQRYLILEMKALGGSIIREWIAVPNTFPWKSRAWKLKVLFIKSRMHASGIS